MAVVFVCQGEPGVELDLLCWGSGELGQTGRNVQGYVGPEEAQLRGFTLGKLGRVKLLACGSSHSIVVTGTSQFTFRPTRREPPDVFIVMSPMVGWKPYLDPVYHVPLQ